MKKVKNPQTLTNQLNNDMVDSYLAETQPLPEGIAVGKETGKIYPLINNNMDIDLKNELTGIPMDRYQAAFQNSRFDMYFLAEPTPVPTTGGELPEQISTNWSTLNDGSNCFNIDDDNGEILLRIEQPNEKEIKWEVKFANELVRRYNAFPELDSKVNEYGGEIDYLTGTNKVLLEALKGFCEVIAKDIKYLREEKGEAQMNLRLVELRIKDLLAPTIQSASK